jgi:hypothetical protein
LNLTINIAQTYYADADGDGYGNAATSTTSCTGTPVGYVSNSTDCDDNASSVHPGATEICFNNIDDDCDGLIDENCACTNSPTANAGSNLNTCQGQSVILSGSFGGGATMATWTTSGSGTFSPNATTLNATYKPSSADEAAGSVILTLTTDAQAPCTPASSSTTLNITALPINVGAINGSTNICNPGINQFVYSVTPVAGASTYNWNLPAGIQVIGSATGNSITVKFIDSYVQVGFSGQICVTANNSNGCANSAQSCITVSAQVSAPVNPPSISGPQAVCPGDIATYSIASVNRAAGYNWSFPSGTSILSGANSNIITVQYPQNFTASTISVVATNACGTSGARTRTVSLNTLSAPGNITGPVDGLCGATNAVYSISAVSGATSYNWTIPAGASIVGNSNSNSIVVNYTNTTVTTGNVTVAAVNNCGVGAARSIAVKFVPGLPGTINGATTVCTNSTENYSIGTVQGASSYIWTVPGGATIINGQGSKIISVVHAAVPSANGIVTVKASNNCGLSAVRVLSVNNIICPRNGQFGSISMIAYPNPAHDQLTVEFTSNDEKSGLIKMIDASGRIVYREQLNPSVGANQKTINVSEFAKGVYLIQVEMNNQIEKLRVIVE